MYYNVDFDLDPKGANYLANRLRRVAKDCKFFNADCQDVVRVLSGCCQGVVNVLSGVVRRLSRMLSIRV